MYNSRAITLLIVMSLGLPSAHARQKQLDLFDLTLEQLLELKVISAVTGVEQGLNTAPASATIVTAKDWQRRGASTLSQALVGVPGLQMSIEPTSGKNIVIRGLSGNFGQQVKLLIDGIPFNRIQDGAKPALDLPLSGFKRIEIVRSPGSATYGADAFAGIINLVSDDDVLQEREVSVAVGAFDHYELAMTGANAWQQVNLVYALNLQKYGDDPDKILAADLQSLFDQQFNTNASRAPGRFNESYQQVSLNLKASWQDWLVSYYGVSGSFSFGAGVAEALDPDNRGNHQSHIVDAKYQFSLFEQDKTEFNLWWQEKHTELPFAIYPAGAVLPIGSDGNLNLANPTTLTKFEQGYRGEPSHDSTLAQASMVSVFSPHQAHTLRWQVGVEYHKLTPYERKNFGPGVLTGTETIVSGELTDVSGTPYAYLPRRSRNILFVSVNDDWQLNDELSLHLGGRYDHYSDFGTTINPRLGIVWQASKQLRLKLLSATAYRAPSFYDLYAVNNPVNIGNPDLKPEQIDTNEVNIGFTLTDNTLLEMSYYRYRATDIIEYVSVADLTGRRAKNQGEIDGWGAEWSLHWRASSHLDISSNISYVDNEDGYGQALTGFADKLASVNINYKVNESSNWNVFWQYTGKQKRALSDTRAALPSANWLSSRYSYQLLNQQMELALVVNNLFDKQGKAPSNLIAEDYPIAGRQWKLELNYQF